MTTVAGAMKAPTAWREQLVALTTTNASLRTGVMAPMLVDPIIIALTVEYLLQVYNYNDYQLSLFCNCNRSRST